MKIFTYTCSDPHSDAGYVDISIMAHSEKQAKKFLDDHLKEKGRREITNKLKVASVPCVEGIIFTNLERNYDQESKV